MFAWVDHEQPAAGVVALRWLRQRHGARKCLTTGTYIDERLVCEHLDEAEKYYSCKFTQTFNMYLDIAMLRDNDGGDHHRLGTMREGTITV